MADRHTITVEDDERVIAVHHGVGSDIWIVFCHGFVSDKTGSYEDRAIRATEEGFDAVRFDFRGCGESDGAFRDQTMRSKLTDLRSVLDYFDPESYVLFGSSFAAKVAFHAAADADRAAAVIGRAPVTYNRTFEATRETVVQEGSVALTDEHRIDGRFFEDFDRYPFEDAAAGITVPVALFHGGADDSVAVADSVEAAETLTDRTDVFLQLLTAEGHRFSREAEHRMREQLFDWLAISGLHPQRDSDRGGETR